MAKKAANKKAAGKNGSKKSLEFKQVNILELLFMAKEEVSVKELEKCLIDKLEEIHVWPEIGIMELNLPNGKTADVETLTEFIDDEEDLKFMDEQNVKSVYAITVEEDALGELMDCVKCWIEEYGGLLCSDSDDFAPYYLPENRRG